MIKHCFPPAALTLCSMAEQRGKQQSRGGSARGAQTQPSASPGSCRAGSCPSSCCSAGQNLHMGCSDWAKRSFSPGRKGQVTQRWQEPGLASITQTERSGQPLHQQFPVLLQAETSLSCASHAVGEGPGHLCRHSRHPHPDGGRNGMLLAQGHQACSAK